MDFLRLSHQKLQLGDIRRDGFRHDLLRHCTGGECDGIGNRFFAAHAFHAVLLGCILEYNRIKLPYTAAPGGDIHGLNRLPVAKEGEGLAV